MKRFSKILLVIFIVAIYNTSFADEVKFTEGTYNDILELAQKENKVVMIDFVTDWCKWCIETDNKVYTVPKVYDYANANQINWKIDAEKGEGIELAKKYKVTGYPTIIFTDSQGNEIDRIYGYILADDFYNTMVDYNNGENTYSKLKSAVEANPEDAEANYKYGEKLISLGQVEEAKPYIEKAVKLDPSNASGYGDDAMMTLAYLNEDFLKLKELINEYPESNKLKEAYVNAAGIVGGKNFNDAKAIYDEAFAKFGNDDELINFNYGMFLLDKAYGVMAGENVSNEDREKALEIITECQNYVRGSVNESTSYYVMAKLYYQMGDLVKANEAIDKAMSLRSAKSYTELKEEINSQNAKK